MPFTPSHIIAVLPFRKFSPNYVSMTGLIAGSVAPDFEFFLRVTLYGSIGHTWWGAVIFDLPVAVLICFTFHLLIKKALIPHLPVVLFRRWGGYVDKDWLTYWKGHRLVVILSCSFGILTHLLWDNFTHEVGYISNFQFAFFLKQVEIGGLSIHIYDILQFLSSLLGLLFLVQVIWTSPTYDFEPVKNLTDKKKYFMQSVTITLGIIFVRYMIGVPDEKPFGQFVVISMSAIMQSQVLLGIYHLKRLKVDS